MAWKKNRNMELLEMNLGSKEKKVIDAFTEKKSASSPKLHTDGKTLDGLWMGGNRIAYWKDGKIYFSDTGSKAADTIVRAVRKIAPKTWIGEDDRSGFGRMIDEMESILHGASILERKRGCKADEDPDEEKDVDDEKACDEPDCDEDVRDDSDLSRVTEAAHLSNNDLGNVGSYLQQIKDALKSSGDYYSALVLFVNELNQIGRYDPGEVDSEIADAKKKLTKDVISMTKSLRSFQRGLESSEAKILSSASKLKKMSLPLSQWRNVR